MTMEEEIAPLELNLLTSAEIARLLPDEAEQYMLALEEYERKLDMEEIAAGLTADLPSSCGRLEHGRARYSARMGLALRISL